jgi:hypothetical protein
LDGFWRLGTAGQEQKPGQEESEEFFLHSVSLSFPLHVKISYVIIAEIWQKINQKGRNFL